MTTAAKDTSIKYCRAFAVAAFMFTDHERLAMLISVFNHLIKRSFIIISGSSTRHTKKIQNKIKALKIYEIKKENLLQYFLFIY